VETDLEKAALFLNAIIPLGKKLTKRFLDLGEKKTLNKTDFCLNKIKTPQKKQ
jgi:hypothetical protein